MVTRYVRKDLTWVDLVSPTPAEVRALMQEFAIDPGLAQELLIPSFKPKVEHRGDSMYVILHFPSLHGSTRRPEQEVDFLIGKRFLITTRYEEIDPLHSFAKAFEVNTVLDAGYPATNGGHLFIAMVRNLYRALDLECDAIHRRLADIEEHVFSGDERKMVIELSQVGRTIHDFRQVILPHKEMLASFESAAMRFFGAEFSYYIRGLEGEYERVRLVLEHLRDSLGELRETNNSLLSTKQNEIMKTLTVLAFVFLPLSFIADLFQMNTRSTPIVGMPGDFWIIIGAMLALAAGFFIYFKKKEWL
jgi:magnesium transporter